MRPIKRTGDKSQTDIGNEWDRIAMVRHKQMSRGDDLSFRHVILPSVMELLGDCNLESVIDIGCGTGNLTKELTAISSSVTAVDVSPTSIEIAHVVCEDSSNVTFYVGTIDEFAQEWDGPQFTVAVANMVLMDCLNIESFLKATAEIVAPHGFFVATFTHPCFWPRYWGYENADWFGYDQQIVLEAPFKISSETTDCVTTHVHRPLYTYINSLRQAGFWIDRVLEPVPSQEIQSLYPEPWEFPRFMVLRLQRESE